MIFISKLLPNPVGRDSLGEIIVIKNSSKSITHLNGWSVENKAGKKFIFLGRDTVSGNSIYTFPHSKTKISLNNKGDTIKLFNSSGVLKDSITYGKNIQEGEFVIHNSPFGKVHLSMEQKTNSNIGNKKVSYNTKYTQNNSNTNFANISHIQARIIYSSNENVIGILLISSIILTIIFWYLFQILTKQK